MSSKRARIDPAAQLPTVNANGSKSYTSPMTTASNHIKDHLMLLRPEFTTILIKHASAVLTARAAILQKQRAFKGMETDETLIPRSARVKFDLSTKHKPVEISTEFITLKDDCAKLVDDLQRNLKSKIVAASKLDIQFLEQAHRKELAKALRLSTTASLIADGLSGSATDTDRMVNTILDRYHEELLKNCQPCSLADFRALYKETHGLPDLPAPRARTMVTSTVRIEELNDTNQGDSIALNYNILGDGERIERPTVQAPARMVAEADREVMKIFRTFESVFVVPW